MTWEQWGVWFYGMLDVPFLILIAMLVVLLDALKLAQKSGGLNMAAMFKDENGKESGLRFALLGCFIFSTWGFMYDTKIGGKVNALIFVLYLATWSGSAIFGKALEKWDGKWPGRGG